MTKLNLRERMKQYDVTKHFDRVCIHLRRGDFDLLRANHPEGVSAWIREQIAEHVDAILAEQEKREKAQRKAMLMAIEDPNL